MGNYNLEIRLKYSNKLVYCPMEEAFMESGGGGGSDSLIPSARWSAYEKAGRAWCWLCRCSIGCRRRQWWAERLWWPSELFSQSAMWSCGLKWHCSRSTLWDGRSGFSLRIERGRFEVTYSSKTKQLNFITSHLCWWTHSFTFTWSWAKLFC